jgi:hypothetical protein
MGAGLVMYLVRLWKQQQAQQRMQQQVRPATWTGTYMGAGLVMYLEA